MSIPETPRIALTQERPVPGWAFAERRLLDRATEAAVCFLDRYTHPDGTLRWRSRWPGMDGADDPYEAFFRFALLAALGAGEPLLELARRQWEAVTWQWTAYGQVHDEFFAYYDWMHHGEGSLYLYYLALADPTSLRFRQRAVKFADLYATSNSINYDDRRRLMRSPLTGTLGPRSRLAAEDWETDRWIFEMYPPPFEDLPSHPLPVAPRLPSDEAASAIPLEHRPKSNWMDEEAFAEILSRINERMVRGDVPLNLTTTSLAAHAFMFTGAERYRKFVLDYLSAWRQRADANDGLVPDNVGLSGRIGEYTGSWFGGYYGYGWPHGFPTVYEPVAVAGSNAALLTGDLSQLDLARMQIDLAWERGTPHNGVHMIPQRYCDGRWIDPGPAEPDHALWLWAVSQEAEDAERVRRALVPSDAPILSRYPDAAGRRRPYARSPYGDGLETANAHWFQYLEGSRPTYPNEILSIDEEAIEYRLGLIALDDSPPEQVDVHHWQDRVPLRTESLVQLTMGAPLPAYHGGLLHAAIRWFDAHARHPGLPPDVAALVESVSRDTVVVTICNTGDSPRQAVIQAGAFGEHRFTRVEVLDEALHRYIGPFESRWLTVDLAPRATGRLRLCWDRFAGAGPSYETPWLPLQNFPSLLEAREIDSE